MYKTPSQYLCHLWFPDLFNATGGVQRYSSFCLKAFTTFAPSFNYDIFIKHDTHIAPKLPNMSFHKTGNWPLSIRTPAFAAQLLSFGLWQSPNLIFSTHLNFIPVAYQIKQLIGTPYWTVAHGIEAWNIQNPTLKRALKHADLILAVSNFTRDRLLKEQDLDPDKVVILPNTFDADHFKITSKPTNLVKRYGLNPNDPVILTVARFSKSEQYKGYDKILTVLPKVRQVIPNVHYVLVGQGDDKPRIEELISQLQLQECVTLTGYIPDDELNEHYNLCDVFAMPSKGEGFGIVYLEALACGKPTLAGNQDGATEPLCQGELGVLVNPDDTEAIAQALIQILQRTYPNPLIYQPEMLRQKVIERFGFQSFQQTLGNYLEKYLGLI
jgi:glycosyltransferase involved in cell wall biosynthesis